MQFWLPFVSAPQRLVPGSCRAHRLWARVRFGGGVRGTLPAGEGEARQRAYARSREEWRVLRDAERRHGSKSPLEGHTAALELFR